MYHKSADSWYIGTENGDFEPENESDVPRKREILVHHFFIGKSVENPPGKSGKIICAIVSEHIPGGHMFFSGHYNAKNPSKWGNFSNF